MKGQIKTRVFVPINLTNLNSFNHTSMEIFCIGSIQIHYTRIMAYLWVFKVIRVATLPNWGTHIRHNFQTRLPFNDTFVSEIDSFIIEIWKYFNKLEIKKNFFPRKLLRKWKRNLDMTWWKWELNREHRR